MFSTEETNHYEILEIQTDATPQEIRDAYLRLKSAYRQGSLAAYSLVSEEETHEILKRVEEAFHTLSHPEKRKEYDRTLGYIGFDFNAPTVVDKKPAMNKVVSIDRVPPMEEQTGEDLLIPPSTDFSSATSTTQKTNTLPSEPEFENTIRETVTEKIAPTPADKETVVEQLILNETEWKGELIRKIREMKKIGLEDLASKTKIQRKYLRAIEEDNYKELPATVFVRGFLNQLSRELKLPADRVVNAFLERYKRVRPN